MNAPSIVGLSLCEWDARWQRLGKLKCVARTAPTEVGLYRASLEQRIVYVGRALEWDNRGLRKRLKDYVRKSNSGRKNEAGQRLHQRADRLAIDVLVTGNDASAADAARRLEHGFIFLYQPEWNFL